MSHLYVGMAERFNAADLKSAGAQASVCSNHTIDASLHLERVILQNKKIKILVVPYVVCANMKLS